MIIFTKNKIWLFFFCFFSNNTYKCFPLPVSTNNMPNGRNYMKIKFITPGELMRNRLKSIGSLGQIRYINRYFIHCNFLNAE